MALIVEDGTGRSDAESYGSVAEADAYHVKMGNTAWAGYTDREARLRRGMQSMTGMYRAKWKGSRLGNAQALDWPRIGVNVDDVDWSEAYEGYGGFQGTYPIDQIPKEVKEALFELALRAHNSSSLMPDLKTRRTEAKVGPLYVKYDPKSPQNTRIGVVAQLLSPYLKRSSSVMMLTR